MAGSDKLSKGGLSIFILMGRVQRPANSLRNTASLSLSHSSSLNSYNKIKITEDSYLNSCSFHFPILKHKKCTLFTYAYTEINKYTFLFVVRKSQSFVCISLILSLTFPSFNMSRIWLWRQHTYLHISADKFIWHFDTVIIHRMRKIFMQVWSMKFFFGFMHYLYKPKISKLFPYISIYQNMLLNLMFRKLCSCTYIYININLSFTHSSAYTFVICSYRMFLNKTSKNVIVGLGRPFNTVQHIV